MKTVAIVQARMGSTRLPGKVMKTLAGQTVLARVIQRIKKCSLVDNVVIATTTQPEDEIIVKEAEKHGADVFRGDVNHVLSRYYQAALHFNAKHIIRITSDCPLLDPNILCTMLSSYLKNYAANLVDYYSNVLEKTYPNGLNVEIFSIDGLKEAYLNAVKNYEQEHVTPYFYENPNRFKLLNYKSTQNFSHHRWTLDTPEDFEFLSAIYNRSALLGKDMPMMQDVLNILEQDPQLLKINSHIEQKPLHPHADECKNK